MRGASKENYKKAINEIKRLEKLIEIKDHQLAEQGAELGVMGRASMEVRKEDSEQLTDYQDTNTQLVEFVKKVAESQSKFGKEAREVLGYES